MQNLPYRHMIYTIFIEKQNEIDVKIGVNVNIDCQIPKKERLINSETNLSAKLGIII